MFFADLYIYMICEYRVWARVVASVQMENH